MINGVDLENIDLEFGLDPIVDPLNDFYKDCVDVLAEDPSKEVAFHSLSQLEIVVRNGVAMSLDDNATAQFYQRLKIPLSYLSRCPTDLQTENVEYWLQQQKKPLLFRTRKIGSSLRARGVLSKRFMTTEATKDDLKALPLILRAHQQLSSDPLTLAQFLKTDHFTTSTSYFRPHITEHEHGTFAPGILVSNSEVGLAALKLQPVIAELKIGHPNIYYISSNPAGSKRFYHVGTLTPTALIGAVSSASEIAQHGVVQLLVRAHEEVDNPASIVRQLLTNKNLLGVTTSALVKEVESLWTDTPSATKLDIARSIITSTQHLDQLSHYRISKIVGRYLEIFIPE